MEMSSDAPSCVPHHPANAVPAAEESPPVPLPQREPSVGVGGPQPWSTPPLPQALNEDHRFAVAAGFKQEPRGTISRSVGAPVPVERPIRVGATRSRACPRLCPGRSRCSLPLARWPTRASEWGGCSTWSLQGNLTKPEGGTGEFLAARKAGRSESALGLAAGAGCQQPSWAGSVSSRYESCCGGCL